MEHHFEGKDLMDEKEALEAVRREEMLGVDFLMEYCDGKFIAHDVSEEVFPYVGSWEDYQEFEHILDEAYASYCKA